MVHAEGPRRLPQAPRRGREARPPQARQGARPLQLPRGGWSRVAALSPQGRASPAPAPGVAARRALRARLRRGHHSAHLQGRRLEDQRALRELPREHVLLRGRRRGWQEERVRHQADELPRSPHDLRQRRSLVPRPADAHVRVRHRVPPRALRRRARPHARPLLHAGRRAHLLHARAGPQRGHGHARPRRLRDGRLRLRVLGRGLDTSREVHRRREVLGELDLRLSSRRSKRAASPSRSTKATAPSTAPRSTSNSRMRSGVPGRRRPSKSTPTCRSASV